MRSEPPDGGVRAQPETSAPEMVHVSKSRNSFRRRKPGHHRGLGRGGAVEDLDRATATIDASRGSRLATPDRPSRVFPVGRYRSYSRQAKTYET
jgi:hypothetical protein